MGERRTGARRRRYGVGHKVDAADRETLTFRLESPDAEPAKLIISSTSYDEQLSIERDQLGGTDEYFYGWTGTRVWEASLIMAQLADARGRSFWRDRRVLELGCGCGLSGIAVAALGADVVLTDLVTQQAQANVAQTFRSHMEPPAVCRLRWGDSGADLSRVAEGGSFDVIIATDCIYNTASWAALLSTISVLSRPGTEVLIVSVQRGDGHSEFFELALSKGFLVENRTHSAELRRVLESETWRRQAGGAQPHALEYHHLVCTAPARI